MTPIESFSSSYAVLLDRSENSDYEGLVLTLLGISGLALCLLLKAWIFRGPRDK